MKKKVLLSSIATIAICLCLIAGSTFALFTSSDRVNVAVTAGKVDITANLVDDSMLTWSSLYQTEKDARTDGYFDNGGIADITDEASVVIERMTPGDVAKFKIDVKNYSDVGIQYRVRMISNAGEHEVDLTEALVITAYIDGFNYPVNGTENQTIWKYVEPGLENINDIWITVSFPSDVTIPEEDYNDDGELDDNDFQEAQANMTFVVEAVQGNANYFNAAADDVNAADYLIDEEGYLAEGNYNGEGNTVTVDKLTLPLNGDVTLSNMTVDATSLVSDWNATILDIAFDEYGNPISGSSTLVLADETTIVAAEDQWAIASPMLSDESFTVIIDPTAKIVASGADGAAILAQGWADSEVNVVLNGSAADCFELNGGATAFSFWGNDGDTLTVNMFVKSETDMAQYARMIEAGNVTVNWYINGTFASSQYFAG